MFDELIDGIHVPNVTRSREAIRLWVQTKRMNDDLRRARKRLKNFERAFKKRPRIEILPRDAFKRPQRSRPVEVGDRE